MASLRDTTDASCITYMQRVGVRENVKILERIGG